MVMIGGERTNRNATMPKAGVEPAILRCEIAKNYRRILQVLSRSGSKSVIFCVFRFRKKRELGQDNTNIICPIIF